MTLHQIIDRAAGHYNLGNRSLVGKSCRYLGANGTRCAFSLFCGSDDLTVKRLQEMDKLQSSLASLDPADLKHQIQCELSDVVLPEVAGAEWGFWADLQTLHDDECLWDKNGINEMGLQHVATLKANWPDCEVGITAIC